MFTENATFNKKIIKVKTYFSRKIGDLIKANDRKREKC
jgi:hypothetical protein